MKKGYRNFFTLLVIGLVGLGVPGWTKDQSLVDTKAAETTTIYFRANENWRTDNVARFAAWIWLNGGEGTWVDLTPTPAETEIFQVAIPSTGYDRIIFARMNKLIATNSWTWGKDAGPLWNQSEDIVLDLTSGNNMYSMFEERWGLDGDGNNYNEVIGYWTKYVPLIIEPPSSSEEGSESSEVPVVEPSIYTVHYWRNDGKQANYDLWLWSDGQSGQAYSFTSSDDYGRVFQTASSNFKNPPYLYLIIRFGDWVQQTPDIKIDVRDYPIVEDGNGIKRRHFYLVDMETTIYKTAEEAKGEKLLSARFTNTSELTVQTYKEPESYRVLKDGLPLTNGNTVASYNVSAYRWSFKINTNEVVDLVKDYTVEVTFKTTNVVKEKMATFDGLFDTSFFIDNYTYSGSDLGVTYSPSASTFKAWAPTTKDLKLRIYNSGTPKRVSAALGNDDFTEHAFTRGAKGVWSVTLSGDYHGKYYTFYATNSAGTDEFADPYAKASGVNGIRGMIVDFSKTNPTGWDNVTLSTKKATEIVPYELHVRDLTADDSWNGTESKRHKFLGLIESNTTYTENEKMVRTGFDHIKELGVNALQILPFYDQENDETNMEFNWGYNPKNYNVLEGGYSSDPYNGLVRINEFKQVVQAYATYDIRIIMDVVYNHVASISQHSFSKLNPGYYFRYSGESPSNASGVGNDTASERIMFERYMVDSTYFWATEYKLGGFRFDLMGLHTVDAMNAVMSKLKTYRSDIIVYGEPWDMDGTVMSVRKDLAKHANLYKAPGVGGFNDQIRDAIKGDPSGAGRGWVQLGAAQINETMLTKIKDGMMGKVTGGTTDPNQVVNYISVHDNYAIFDKLQVAGKPDYDIARIKQQSVQAEAMSLLSQGVGFIHAGSEIMRSKPLGPGYFDHNSYKSPDSVNAIKWDEKWDNLAYHNYYRQMIALKTKAGAFNQNNRATLDSGGAGVETKGSNLIKLTYNQGSDVYTIYHFGVGTRADITDVGGQEVVLDTSGVLKTGSIAASSFKINANTTLVTRNVRDRGAIDPTIVTDIPYLDGSEVVIPGDSSSSMPTTTSLPDNPTSGDSSTSDATTSGGGTSEVPPSSEPDGDKSTISTPVIIVSSIAGVGTIGGMVFFILKLIGKKRL